MLSARKGLLLLLLSALLVFAAAEDPPQYDFMLGEEYTITLNKTEIVYFKFKVPFIANYDLSIIADPAGDSDPDVFLSTKEKFPHTKDASEYYSTSYGYSSIYIPNAEVKTDTEYYLGVACATEYCEFNLTVTYAQEYFMRANVSRAIIEYSHEGTLVARVYVPKSPNAGHIVFAAELVNINEIDEGLHMYANAGNEIPSSQKHDVVATVAWKDGKAAYIYNGDKYFCTDCNYTLVIQAPRKSKVVLSKTVYGEHIYTPMNFERSDAVERGHNVTYVVNTTRVNSSTPFLFVEIKPYVGYFKVYANFGTLPEKPEDYRFTMVGHSEDVLWIPVDPNFDQKTLYITIYAFSHTTYNMRVYQMGSKNLALILGEPETSYVDKDIVENFLTVVDGSKDMKMTFSLHPEKGHVDLFVKSCSDKSKCSFTKSEVDSILSGETQTSKRNPILQFSNVTDGDEVINLQFDGSACNPTGGNKVPRCYFAVGVLGTAKGTSKFTLTATKVGVHAPLRIGRPTRQHLSLDEYKYYYFTVSNDAGIDSIDFQLTKISGDAGIYISRTSRYPDAYTREKVHHYNDLYSFEKKNFSNLNGTYFVGVKAFSSATFSIMPIVKYNTDSDTIGTHHLVKLTEGIPQKMVLDNQEAVYFKFESNFDADDSNNGIEISLNEVQGSFEICVRNDGQMPTPSFCQLSTNGNSLVIPSSSEYYLDVGKYVVAVFPKTSNHTTGTKKATAQSFSITWAAFHHFRTLVFNIPFASSVSKHRSIFYKFEAHPTEDKEIIIHKTTTSSSNAKVDLLLANSDTKFGHNTSDFEYDKASNGSDTIRLSGTDVNTLCSKSSSTYDIKKCYLYIAVTTTSDDDVHFTLSLAKDYDDLRLAESVQTYYTFPSKIHPLHMYYYPHHLEDVTFLAHTWGRNIILYANVINTREHSSRRDWNFPTNRTHEYVSKESASHKGESRLRIPAADLSSCGADYDKFRCGIALTLIYDAPHSTVSNGHETPYKEYSMFSIIANQEITPISAGKPIHTSVNENSYRYFDLYVSKEQATLLISATVLSGKHMVILATKGKDARPTLGNAEFMGAYGKMETLEISGEETIQGTAKGDWVIGVYGFSQTEFVLNVVYEKTKMIELHRGLPITTDLYRDPVFFEYFHETDSAFQIKLTRERGAGIISVRKYPEGRQLAGNLPNATNGDIIRHFDHVQTMISIDPTSSNFCKDCLYIIAVFPHKSMKVSVVAQLPGQFIFLQDNMIFTDYAANHIINRYEHVAWADRVVDINMVVYSGEPRIYVGHNPTVNETNHIWYYNEVHPNNYIRLRLDNKNYKGLQLAPVWDGQNIVPSQSNVYYIMVTAPIPSNYSIAISISNSTRYLIDGHMDFGFLNHGEFNLYKYHVSQDSGTNSTYKLKLQFGMYRDEFFGQNETFHRPHITVMSVPQNKKNLAILNHETLMPELPVIDPVRSDVLERRHSHQSYIMNLQYLAPSDHDFYIIVNNTKAIKHLNYSITANTHEPLYLTLNNMHASRVPVGESDIYAVHATHAGILVIEIHECMGKVVIESSHSRHFVSKVHNAKTTTLTNIRPTIDDESFTGQSSVEPEVIPNLNTLTSSTLGSHIQLASIEIQEEQTIYIIVTGLDGEIDSDVLQDRDAVYKIRANLHPLRDFMPFNSLMPGNDGNVQWDVTSGGKLKLGFNEVENIAYMSSRTRSSKFGDIDIKYQYDLFFTKDQQASTYLSRCDMFPKSEGKFKGMDRYHTKLTVDQASVTADENNQARKSIEVDFEDDEITQLYATLKVTAVGVDSKGNAVWDYPLIYQTAEIKNLNPSGVYSFLTFLLGLCMVMLVIALIGLYYYYEKFKRVKARLNYEMQDLRNIASTVESFDVLDDTIGEKKKGGYHGLIEEENV